MLEIAPYQCQPWLKTDVVRGMTVLALGFRSSPIASAADPSFDARRAYVSSANFTDRGQERSIEVGVLVKDIRFALQPKQQRDSVVRSRVMDESYRP